MAGAGFYSIHTDKLTFAADGRWYADDEPVEHPRLASLFSRHMRRKPAGGYEIWIDERYHSDVDVEDTPFVVVSVDDHNPAEFTVRLNDDTDEAIEPTSLHVGEGDVLYCRVKHGAERARFLRTAYHHLANHIREQDDGSFCLDVGDRTYPIANDVDE